MARRRYQRGSVFLKGTREKVWYVRFLDDVVRDGKLVRVHRSQRLGRYHEFPSRKLALRQADLVLAKVNSPCYAPHQEVTFLDLATKWQDIVMPNHKPASQASEKGHLNHHLIPYFGPMLISDINTEVVQRFISGRKVSPKTIRNIMDTFRIIWKSAKAWGYAEKDVYCIKRGEENVTLPRMKPANQPVYSLEQMRQIIAETKEPYKTMFWIVAETGMRGGEVCGLGLEDIDLNNGLIFVRRSTWRGELQTPKTANAVRCFPISTQLVDHLRLFIQREHRKNDLGLLFVNRDGTPLDNSNVVKYALRPVTKRLGFPPAGLHALRHGNATELDRMGTPIAVRTERLGHSQFSTTLRYTHAMSADHRHVAEEMGRLLAGGSHDPNAGRLLEEYSSSGDRNDSSRKDSAISVPSNQEANRQVEQVIVCPSLPQLALTDGSQEYVSETASSV